MSDVEMNAVGLKAVGMRLLGARLTRRAVLAALAAALAVWSWPGVTPAAARQPEAVRLDEKQQADLARVERYLNSIRTLRAQFLQVADNGATDHGQVLISRPGLMRIEYAPPSPHLIVADGYYLIYHEKKLNQTSHIPLSSSLAGFLVRDTIKLSGDIVVTGFHYERGAIRLTVVQKSEPEAGQLTLVFSDNPLQLRQWTVTDGQGAVTRITLMNPEFGVPLDKKLFAFQPPEREDPRR